MPHPTPTPQFIADALVVAFLAIEALRWRRQWPPLRGTDRGTTPVFWGCYVVTLLALNTDAPSPVVAPLPVAWIGLIAAAGGLARIATTFAAARSSAQTRGLRERSDSLGNLVFWIGAATASLNVIALLTVAVAMLAATGVRLSAETAGATRSASARALSGK